MHGLFYIAFAVFVVMAISSCQKIRTEEVEVEESFRAHADTALSIKMIVDTLRISYKDYVLMVKSDCANIAIRTDQRHALNPACSKQSLIFIDSSDTLMVDYPMATIEQTLDDGSQMNVLENVIYDIGLMIGDRGVLFVVSGYGGCNSCPEWYGLYNTNGELLWHSYSTAKESISSSGSYKSVLVEYGVDERVFSHGDYYHVYRQP